MPTQRLLGGVDRGDVVVVPRHVAALVGRDGGLDVGAGQPRDHQVHHVADGRVAGVGLHVAGVLLGAHLVLAEQVAQRDARRAGPCACRAPARRPAAPSRARCLPCGMPIDTENAQLMACWTSSSGMTFHALTAVALALCAPSICSMPHSSHDALGDGGVHEAAVHVDVAVQHVVLRVLVRAVDALLGEHDRDLGPRDAAHVAVEVDRPSDLVFDQVERAPGDPALLAGDRDAAHALGRAFEQAVDVALAGGADDHHVVGAVPGGHAHAADVVFEASRRDLGRHDAVGLRVDVVEVVRRRQRDAVREALRGLPVAELVELLVGDLLAPRPAEAARAVVLDARRAARRRRASRWA